MRVLRLPFVVCLIVVSVACGGLARPRVDPVPLVAELDGWRPAGLAEEPWLAALARWSEAAEAGDVGGPILAIADLSLPSDEARLWVVDLSSRTAWRTRVAHGSGSGGRWATRFSNTEGSHQTSVGLYRGAEIYVGKHGRSLRLDGLDPSNDQARRRSIVVHGASYVTDAWVAEHGRAGRSWGCPAVSPEVSDALVDALAGGGALMLWHPGG